MNARPLRGSRGLTDRMLKHLQPDRITGGTQVSVRVARHYGSCRVADVDTLCVIHPFDGRSVLRLHNLSLELLRWRQLVLLLREISWEDHELLNREGVVLADLRVLVRLIDGIRHGLDPDIVVHGRTDGGDSLIDTLCSSIKVVSARRLAIGANRLQRYQGAVVLLVVADHHDLVDTIARLLDGILDWDGRDVLTSGADDELLVASCDLHHAVLAHEAFVA